MPRSLQRSARLPKHILLDKDVISIKCADRKNTDPSFSELGREIRKNSNESKVEGSLHAQDTPAELELLLRDRGASLTALQ
jgi:hypothetical protein